VFWRTRLCPVHTSITSDIICFCWNARRRADHISQLHSKVNANNWRIANDIFWQRTHRNRVSNCISPKSDLYFRLSCPLIIKLTSFSLSVMRNFMQICWKIYLLTRRRKLQISEFLHLQNRISSPTSRRGTDHNITVSLTVWYRYIMFLRRTGLLSHAVLQSLIAKYSFI